LLGRIPHYSFNVSVPGQVFRMGGLYAGALTIFDVLWK